MRRLLCLSTSALTALVAQGSRADEVASVAALVPVPLVLVGSAGGGGGAVSRAPAGFFLGADGSAAVILGTSTDSTRTAAAFDVHAGYAFRWGLSLQGRFDDLGVRAPDPGGPLMLASVGARYSFPLVVMPFVEANVGPIFDSLRISLATLVGLGVALPINRHLLIDLAIHDVIGDVDGLVRNTMLFSLGLEVGFIGR